MCWITVSSCFDRSCQQETIYVGFEVMLFCAVNNNANEIRLVSLALHLLSNSRDKGWIALWHQRIVLSSVNTVEIFLVTALRKGWTAHGKQKHWNMLLGCICRCAHLCFRLMGSRSSVAGVYIPDVPLCSYLTASVLLWGPALLIKAQWWHSQ